MSALVARRQPYCDVGHFIPWWRCAFPGLCPESPFWVGADAIRGIFTLRSDAGLVFDTYRATCRLGIIASEDDKVAHRPLENTFPTGVYTIIYRRDRISGTPTDTEHLQQL